MTPDRARSLRGPSEVTDLASRGRQRPSQMVWTPPGSAAIICRELTETHQCNQEETGMDATTIGVDLAKNVFEVAMATRSSGLMTRRRLTRPQFERFLQAQA